jgi:hypothetical protein
MTTDPSLFRPPVVPTGPGAQELSQRVDAAVAPSNLEDLVRAAAPLLDRWTSTQVEMQKAELDLEQLKLKTNAQNWRLLGLCIFVIAVFVLGMVMWLFSVGRDAVASDVLKQLLTALIGLLGGFGLGKATGAGGGKPPAR